MSGVGSINPVDWYWGVKDTNFTTKVYSTASRAYVNNNVAAFTTWLSRGNFGYVLPIISASNNAGAIKLQLPYTTDLATGQTWAVAGTGTAADGNWVITVNDGTHVTLQGSTFVATLTGVFRGMSIIDTNANLVGHVGNTAIVSNLAGAATSSSAANVTLTNPMVQFATILITAGGKKVILPPMNDVHSIGVGMPFVIWNKQDITGFQFDVVAQDGTTLIATLNPGDRVECVLQDNSTANGTIQAFVTRLANDVSMVRGLTGAFTSAVTTGIGFDAATVQDIWAVTTGISASSFTVDISVAGPTANGRDQGAAFGAGATVHFYVIWGVVSGVAGLASGVAPNAGGLIPSMPTGYTNWAYMFSVVLTGAAQLPVFTVRGDRVSYQARQLAVNAGAAVAETAVSVAALVPAVAVEFDIAVDSWGVTSDAGGIASSLLHLGYIATVDTHLVQGLLTGGALDGTRWGFGDITFPNNSQSFHYHQQVLNGTAPSTTISLRNYRCPNGGP